MLIIRFLPFAHVTAMFYLAIGYFGGDFLSFCENKKICFKFPCFFEKKTLQISFYSNHCLNFPTIGKGRLRCSPFLF
jgi:hypothetical protein